MKAYNLAYVLLFVSLFTFHPKWVAAASSSEPIPPCQEIAGSLVSVQGKVEIKKSDSVSWQEVKVNSVYCKGDSIRVLRNSRAALLLDNDTVIRLDENTTLRLMAPQDNRPLLLKLLQGVLFYFSIKPQSLELETPFVNGAVEGTEFIASTTEKQSQIAVIEGQVLLNNEIGSVSLRSGQRTTAGKGQRLLTAPLVKSADTLQWTLYYPPLLDLKKYLVEDRQQSDVQKTITTAVQYFFKGDLFSSLQVMEGAGNQPESAAFHTVRASLYLTAGRVKEAEEDIASLFTLDKNDSHVPALQSVISLIKGDLKGAKILAHKALSLDPASPAALVAMSYTQQAEFHLDAAVSSIQQALAGSPDNGLLLARYAELLQSTDNTSNRAVQAGKEAVQKSPYLSRPHTVLGFAHLNRLEIDLASQSFQKAIDLDQTAPLPRLGMGLVAIYHGRLTEGRNLLSIATALDPGNSLVRSYLGKAYFEEKDFDRADRQFQLARSLDPHDPTPYFYSAILNIKENQPGTALLDLKKSIELNDNRAIFRSRLLLDKDSAARSVGAGRVFNQLGFEQLALNYGAKSLDAAPSDYSSHRLLSDSYASMPRHEIARVSELLQSQLLQPVNIRPVQPQLAESDLQILDGSGPSAPSFHEYSTMFDRNGINLLVNGIGGGNDTLGNDFVASGVYDKFSFSLGQFYYTTDGFRENNDLEQKLFNGIAQYRLSPSTHFMAELRSSDKEYGDRSLLFDPMLFNKGLRQETDNESWRIGGRHALTAESEIIATFISQQSDEKVISSGIYGSIISDEDVESINGEIQHLYSGDYFRSVVGGSLYDGELEESTHLNGMPLGISEKVDLDHETFYAYSYTPLTTTLTLTAGLNYTKVENGKSKQDLDSTSPKFGLLWQPLPTTSLRLAWIEGVTRSLISEQTIEPTQVAGFNQFYDDVVGTETELYGLGLDHELSSSLYGGVSYIHRNLDTPYRKAFALGDNAEIKFADWQEQTARAYMYWLAGKEISVSMEYTYEKFDHGAEFSGTEFFEELTTHRGKVQLSWFHSSGLRAELSETFVDQQGSFVDQSSFIHKTKEDSDSFWVTDASIGYLFAKGDGMISLQAKNLFDTNYHFQDTDPAVPRLSPGRLLLVRFSYNF